MPHLDYLRECCDLNGKDVIDIGAGAGRMAQAIAKCGANVTGVEIDPAKVAIADEAAAKHASPDVLKNLSFVLGRAENIPVDDASMDVICLFYSLHHIPLEVQEKAFEEIRRIGRLNAHLHVVDPLPFGDMSEVMKPLEDETHVRTMSQKRLDELDPDKFSLVKRHKYTPDRTVKDLDAFIKSCIAVDPRRADRLEQSREEIAERFAHYAKPIEGGFRLTQPCVMYHFTVNI